VRKLGLKALADIDGAPSFSPPMALSRLSPFMSRDKVALLELLTFVAYLIRAHDFVRQSRDLMLFAARSLYFNELLIPFLFLLVALVTELIPGIMAVLLALLAEDQDFRGPSAAVLMEQKVAAAAEDYRPIE
jgi:hypothetical protein